MQRIKLIMPLSVFEVFSGLSLAAPPSCRLAVVTERSYPTKISSSCTKRIIYLKCPCPGFSSFFLD